MPRKNRGYKRGAPYRDSALFVIACEGAVREREYFEHLGEYSTRIRFNVLQNTNGNSAPKWLLDSAARYTEETKLTDDDQLWFVMDTDHWPDQQLRTIHEECEKRKNWFMALSNPCFEVWLFLHVKDAIDPALTTCQDLKTALSTAVPGGYNKKSFIRRIRVAQERCLALDTRPNHFVPSEMHTKVHLLAKEVLELIGRNSTL